MNVHLLIMISFLEWQANPFCCCVIFFFLWLLGCFFFVGLRFYFNSIMLAVDHLQITIVGYLKTYTSQMYECVWVSGIYKATWNRLFLLLSDQKKLLLIFMSFPLVSFPFFRVLWAGIYFFHYYFQFRNIYSNWNGFNGIDTYEGTR